MVAPPSLSEVLREWSDEALATLFRARPDLLAPVPSDLGALAARAGYPGSVARALEGLTRPHLHVVEALCVLPAPTSRGEVARLLGADPGDLVGRLRDLALVWGDDDSLTVVPAARQLLPDPAGLGQPAEELLRLRPSAALKQLTDNLGLTAAAGSTLQALAAVYADPDALDRLLADLEAPARAVLERLTAGSPLGQVDDAARIVPLPAARTPVDAVLARGLLLPVDSMTVALPREVGLRLRGGTLYPDWSPRPPVATYTQLPTGDVDRAGAGAALTAVTSVTDLLEPWGSTPPAVLRSGGLGVRELRRLAADLGTDESAVALFLETAWAAGLLSRSPSGEHWLPTDSFDTWRLQEPAARWAALAWAWLWWPRVPALVGLRERDRLLAALGPDLDYAEAVPVRWAVLSGLAALPKGAAPTADQLADRLGWEAPLRFGELGRQLLDWNLQEAQQLGLTSSGALTSYGRALVDSPAAEPTPAAAQAAQAAAADAVSGHLPTSLDYVLIQADLTAVAPGPLTAEVADALSLAADVESRGGATVYRFTAGSIRRALDAGRSATELHSWLTSVSRTPVPQPLTYLVDDVARRHGRVRVGAAAAYLRCDDEAVLAELVADRRTAGYGFRLLAPTVLTSTAPPEALLEALRSWGLAPALESASGEVVLRRPDVRRAPTPRRVASPPRDSTSPPSDVLLATAVRALRAGDRVRNALDPYGADAGTSAPPLARTSPGETLTLLRDAARHGHAVWIGYVNAEGGASVRLIEPMSVSGGYVSAYDHLREESRTFAVHRITGAATAEVDAGA